MSETAQFENLEQQNNHKQSQQNHNRTIRTWNTLTDMLD